MESVDAGELIGTALAVGAGVSSIQGQVDSNRITGVVDIDVYRLELPAGEFSAAVTASTGDLDTALVLFDGTGKGLQARHFRHSRWNQVLRLGPVQLGHRDLPAREGVVADQELHALLPQFGDRGGKR